MKFNAEKTKTANDLVKAFMEHHGIRFGLGGTPLPAAIGTFPFDEELIKEMCREGIRVKERDPNSVTVIDGERAISRVLHFRSWREIWIYPCPTIDYHSRSVACSLVIQTGDLETFPVSQHRRICKAITAAHPDCHQIIKRATETDLVLCSWNESGFGELLTLDEVFSEFARSRPVLRVLANHIGLFDPFPAKSQFVGPCDIPQIRLAWEGQLSCFKEQL